MIDLEKRAKAWDEFSGEAREFTIGDTFNSAYELGCQAVYDRVIERLQKLPEKIRDKFSDFIEDIDAVLPPEWPDELEENK